MQQNRQGADSTAHIATPRSLTKRIPVLLQWTGKDFYQG